MVRQMAGHTDVVEWGGLVESGSEFRGHYQTEPMMTSAIVLVLEYALEAAVQGRAKCADERIFQVTQDTSCGDPGLQSAAGRGLPALPRSRYSGPAAR